VGTYPFIKTVEREYLKVNTPVYSVKAGFVM